MRILSPDDFGLVAKIIIVLTAFNVFLDLGYSQAIIQQKDSTQKSLSSHFYLGAFIGLILGIILFISSSFISNYFHQPEIQFPLRLFTITLLTGGTVLIHRSILYKEMEFKKIAFIDIFSIIISGVIALYLAWNDWGFMAIVYQMFSNAMIQSILYWIISPFVPILYFKIVDIKKTSTFSFFIFLTEGINYLSNMLDQFLTAIYFSNVNLGLYNRSVSLIKNPANIIPSTNEAVLFPLFSKLNQTDSSNDTEIFIRTSGVIAFLFTPLLFIYYFFAEYFVSFILGSKWIEIIPYTKVMALIAVLLVTKFGGSMLLAKAKTKELFYLNICTKTIIILATIIGIQYGIIPLLWSLLIAECINRILQMIVFNKFLELNIIQYLKQIIPPFILGFLFSSILFLLEPFLPNSLWIFTILFLGYIAYILLISFFTKTQFSKDFRMLIKTIK